MVEPVKYTRDNVIEVKPGDVIPGNSLIWFRNNHCEHRSTSLTVPESTLITHYAPAPILELPQEVEFGDAMTRIRDGEELLWELEDMREVVGQDRRVLCFMRSPSSYPINNFGELGDGRFYEIPYPSKPQPKTTGLTYEEALLSGKPIRHTKMGEIERLCWDGDGTLVWTGGNAFIVRKKWLTPEWEIVE